MKRAWRPGCSWILVSRFAHLLAPSLSMDLGRESMNKRSKGSSEELDSFRKIKFDDWLRLFMQVRDNRSEKCLRGDLP